MHPLQRILFIFVSVALLVGLAVAINYVEISQSNTAATHFDSIIVLGYPANSDGTPSPEQRERVLEAVREYRAGVAPYLIMTGGPAHNRFVEAHVMAEFAVSQGVPKSAIVEEPQAQNTIQNVYYSAVIMHQRNWISAEVVSSRSHLPRASLILATFDRVQPSLAIRWRSHAALWSKDYNILHILLVYSAEAAYCLRLRIAGFPGSRFLPKA